MVVFVIWILFSLIYLSSSASALHSEEPVRFWNIPAQIKVSNVKRYNQSVAWLWIVYAVVLDLIGVLVAWGKGTLTILISIFIITKINIACMYIYEKIEVKYRVFDRKQSWWR